MQKIIFKKINLEISSANCWPFCLHLNVLKIWFDIGSGMFAVELDYGMLLLEWYAVL